MIVQTAMESALVTAMTRIMGEKVAILIRRNKNVKEITDIEEKMEKLKELLMIVNMVIQDVESRPFTYDVKILSRKLRYLVYDLEDVVDCYDTEVLRKQRSRASFRSVHDFFSSNNQILFRSRLGSMIKAVTDSLDSILLQKSKLLNLSQGNFYISPSDYKTTHSSISSDIMGRETEKQRIVDLLTDDDDVENNQDTMKVIAIVGMGGLGKTRLAQLVFNDEKVKAHFASWRMWTVIGMEFDPTKIMKSILEQATNAPSTVTEINSVRQKLEHTLSGKRFLLVLDDVWNEDATRWGELRAALTCGARGSKILVTSRSLHVSSIMNSFITHQIQQLPPDDCLPLFQQFAFGDEEKDQKLMDIGRKIVEKCGGVPLAIISLGSMLHNIQDETHWSSVLNSKIWQLRDEEQKVLAALKWSYDTLPPQSKKCFAFASLFPKGYTIEKDELVRLWMANGFVQSEGNVDAKTMGNRVFDDLVLRSFFLLTPSKEHDFGDDSHVTKCMMHDLMHDLARSVSGDVYWNVKEDLVTDIGNRTYHLLLYVKNLSNAYQALLRKPLYLRTLILSDCYLYLNANLLEIIFSELKFLRVLDLSSNKIKKVPKSIGNLIQLRYLNLSRNNIEVLPNSITLLHNLQYLNLSWNEELQELPKELRSMCNINAFVIQM
ncbi:putative disease resistance protein RGA4 [Zingiber officinale]|uniref:putative disease resistance protein RGA4 n=1 Tax=Zingiber officinale TaxID=94328 RepID=UPI001C4CE965|nr:putative disease resistance protein RGA4 [Zingiber officinale]